MKRAVVTGGHGFIGTHLVQALTARGIEAMAPSHTEMDIVDKESVFSYMKDHSPEWVFHLAGYRGDDSDEAERVNVQGTVNILNAALDVGVAAFVHAGTCMEYGDAAVPFCEDAALRPHGVYAASKARSSDIVMQSSVPSVVLRFTNVYGPDSARDLFHLIRSAFETKGSVQVTTDVMRDYVYIDDVVRACLLAAERITVVQGRVINISSNSELTTEAVVRRAEEILRLQPGALRSPLPYVASGYLQRSNRADNAVAKRLLGWQPHISFEDGLQKSLSR